MKEGMHLTEEKLLNILKPQGIRGSGVEMGNGNVLNNVANT